MKMDGIHEVHIVERNLPKDICGPARRPTKIQTITRPDHIWPEAWTKNWEKNRSKREKHKWAIENPNLDNARSLRGIYSLDPSDEEYKDIITECKTDIGNSNGSGNAL